MHSALDRPSRSLVLTKLVLVRVNKLNEILPEMYKSRSLICVTCASSLFNNAGVEENLITDRSGHRYVSLFKHEKASDEKIKEMSTVLGPSNSASVSEVTITKQKEESSCSDIHENETAGALNSCSFFKCSVKIKVNYNKYCSGYFGIVNNEVLIKIMQVFDVRSKLCFNWDHNLQDFHLSVYWVSKFMHVTKYASFIGCCPHKK